MSSATAAPAADPETSTHARLGEITVTAQRREENSQSVPIAIDTISAEDLELKGAVSLFSLSNAVPGLSTSGSLWVGTYVRGVGSVSASPNNEPSVATYIDGVYNASSYALQGFAFNNIERLEVLKGPQGTLFGRNATGGVVQIITSDPQQEFSGKFSAGYANYQTVQASAYMTGGITENLAIDLAVGYEDQGDGFGTNIVTGAETYLHENIAARSKLLYTPTESTQASVAAYFSSFEHEGYNNQLLPGSFASDGVTTYPGRFNATANQNSGNDNEQYGVSLKVDHDFGALRLTSISGYSKVDAHWQVDNDNTPNPWVVVNDFSNQKFLTQEFHLSNSHPGRVDWLIGAFYYDGEVDNVQIRTGDRVTGGLTEAFGIQQAESVSLFAQAAIEVVTDTRLTLGARHTDETLKFDGYTRRANGTFSAGPLHNESDYQPWTWRVALDRQFTPDVLGYISWNRGFKSGAFNLTTPTDAALLPEELDAYEIGVKSEFLDHRVRLNVAAFFYDYQSLQISVSAGGGGQIFQNGAAENYGLDIGLDVLASENVSLSFGASLLEAEYTNYPNARGFTNTGVAIPVANAAGRPLTNAPEFSGYFTVNYRKPTTIGDIKTSMTLSYNDKTYVSPVDLPVRPAYTLLSASAEWWSQSDSPTGVRVWGRNLLDEYYSLNLIANTGGWLGNYSPPRMYGVTLLKRF